MIELSVTQYPVKEIIARCGECKAEIWRQTWDTYADYQRKRGLAKKLYKKCPSCGAKTEKGGGIVQWTREANGDYLAKREKGDFLVWKYGRIWKGRYRAYGTDKPVMLGFSSTLEGMKRRCERSEYWTKG